MGRKTLKQMANQFYRIEKKIRQRVEIDIEAQMPTLKKMHSEYCARRSIEGRDWYMANPNFDYQIEELTSKRVNQRLNELELKRPIICYDSFAYKFLEKLVL